MQSDYFSLWCFDCGWKQIIARLHISALCCHGAWDLPWECFIINEGTHKVPLHRSTQKNLYQTKAYHQSLIRLKWSELYITELHQVVNKLLELKSAELNQKKKKFLEESSSIKLNKYWERGLSNTNISRTSWIEQKHTIILNSLTFTLVLAGMLVFQRTV